MQVRAFLPLVVLLGCSEPSDTDTASETDTSPEPTDSGEPSSVEAIGDGTLTEAWTGDCPASTMMDVSGYDQTQDYAAPELSASCDDSFMTVSSNGIPNFEFVAITPNELQTQEFEFKIPLNPEEAPTPETLEYVLGTIAVAVNGLPLYGPSESPTHGWADPFLDEILDYCNGHTAPGGVYHFHARPDCLYPESDGSTSLILGWSFDGYPILAPWMCADEDCTTARQVRSSYERTSDATDAFEAHEFIEGSGDLDECNGMVGPDGTYRYYATSTYPYFQLCYHGVVPEGAGQVGGSTGAP